MKVELKPKINKYNARCMKEFQNSTTPYDHLKKEVEEGLNLCYHSDNETVILDEKMGKVGKD